MNKEIENIKRTVEKLRADLMATNIALQCVMTSMPPDAQRQSLKAIAQLDVMQEQFVEQTQTPEVQELMQLVRQSVERLYQSLQGAHKMRMRKLGEPPETP
jgi:hypothetical protein